MRAASTSRDSGEVRCHFSSAFSPSAFLLSKTYVLPSRVISRWVALKERNSNASLRRKSVAGFFTSSSIVASIVKTMGLDSSRAYTTDSAPPSLAVPMAIVARLLPVRMVTVATGVSRPKGFRSSALSASMLFIGSVFSLPSSDSTAP